MKASPPIQPLSFSVLGTNNLCLCDNSVFSFLTCDPRYYCTVHKHSSEDRNTSTSGCFLGTHFCNSWVVCKYKPLYCHSHTLRWSAILFSFYWSGLEAKAWFKESFLSVKNWIFQTTQHFTCSKHCSHWLMLHLWMELARNILLTCFHWKKCHFQREHTSFGRAYMENKSSAS